MAKENLENINNKETELKQDVNYWRSFEDLYRSENFIENSHHEFGKEVKNEFELSDDKNSLSRRKFLALVGASAALAGAGCADFRDKGKILPYTNKPEEVVLGKPVYYASICTACEENCGVLIKTREGRPIKVDGNPDHPVSKGKICGKGQAEILNLYDPARYSEPLLKKGNDYKKITWKEADEAVKLALLSNGDKEIAIVTHTVTSPSAFKLLSELKTKYPQVQFYHYELFDDKNKSAAFEKCYGTTVAPNIQWDKADVIVSFEHDFLGVEGNRVENNRLYSSRRDVNNLNNFNRMYVVEGNLSLTGSNADYRLRIKTEFQIEVVYALLNDFINKRGAVSPANGNLSGFISNFTYEKVAQNFGLDKSTLKYLADDLWKSKGKAIVSAGRAHDVSMHTAVNLLNEVLGNTSLYNFTNQPLHSYSSMNDFKDLVSKMRSKRVGIVVHFDSNPVYHLPKDLGYTEALNNVGNVISLATMQNESTTLSNLILPINHGFESWGDAKTRSGFYALQQPVIAPLYRTRQKEAIILSWLSSEQLEDANLSYYEYVIANWKNNIYPTLQSSLGFEKFWTLALHDGVVQTKENSTNNFSFNASALYDLKAAAKKNEKFSLQLVESFVLGDGRFANNGWLQELAHPISKVTWDNYAAISYNSSKSLNVKNDDLVEVTVNNTKLTLPVLVQPGLADGLIAIELGYGRTNSPVVANEVGVNANQFLTSNNSYSHYYFQNAEISKVEGAYKLATTQDHHIFDQENLKDIHLVREIIREGTISQYKKDPEFIAHHKFNAENMYHEYEYKEAKWAMAIDLNKCTGCSECVIACNAENNIPVIGRDQVLKSREMQWLRIDRYYAGSPETAAVSYQPMLCQHCDLAPCEKVCPVVATTHSPDGLNQMVYNRCVGTRYCSNNCPYKVRRYNFFNFRHHFRNGFQQEDSFSLLHNPEVTVRSRGVMEKCTFCIQRIMEERENATREGRKLNGENVTTACQDSCGTNAIKFGDINNPDSEIVKYRNHKLGYFLLEETNVKPNVTYLAKLKNTQEEGV